LIFKPSANQLAALSCIRELQLTAARSTSRLLALFGPHATVHLMGTRKSRDGIVVRGTEQKYEDSGRLDHIAFAASDVEGMRKARLQSKNVKFRGSLVSRTGDTQILSMTPMASAWS
jgi:hypothetical protein